MAYNPRKSGVIGVLYGANLNITTDQAILMTAKKYNITKIIVTDVSADISAGLAAGGVYTAAAKAGTAIVTAAQLYTALTAATKTLSLTLAALTDYLTGGTVYFSLTVANGSAATANIYIIGDTLE